MSEWTFGQLLDEAKKSGVGGEVPKGNYTLEIKNANSGQTKAGDKKFGFQWKVVGGEHDGTTFWDNLQFVPPRDDKKGNLAVTFAQFDRYGIPKSFFEANPSDEEVKEEILKIGKIQADVEFVQSGQWRNVQIRNVKHLGNVDTDLAPPPSGASAPAGRSF